MLCVNSLRYLSGFPFIHRPAHEFFDDVADKVFAFRFNPLGLLFGPAIEQTFGIPLLAGFFRPQRFRSSGRLPSLLVLPDFVG
jgi:hypothetical protein